MEPPLAVFWTNPVVAIPGLPSRSPYGTMAVVGTPSGDSSSEQLQSCALRSHACLGGRVHSRHIQRLSRKRHWKGEHLQQLLGRRDRDCEALFLKLSSYFEPARAGHETGARAAAEVHCVIACLVTGCFRFRIRLHIAHERLRGIASGKDIKAIIVMTGPTSS